MPVGVPTRQRYALKMQEFAQLNISEGNKEEDSEMDMSDWEVIFNQLDPKDGIKDGKIRKEDFLEWIDTLNFQKTVMLEAEQGIQRLGIVKGQ